jgi:long-chain acyl-CoA synthetase
VLAVGGANVVMERFDAEETLRLIEAERISTMFIVPTMIQRLIHSPRFATTDLSSLRSVMYGGAPIPVERLEPLIERVGPALIHILGMTEAPYPICTLQREEHWIGNPKLGCIGKATTVCEVKLVDDDGREVKTGEVGEILIRGENVMDGYWNDEEATRAVLKDGWLSSGDLAVSDEEGNLRIVDRKKDVIITGGFNVYPKELEELLAAFDEVLEAAVVGHPHSDWGEMVVAYLVAKPGCTIDPGKIDAWAQHELAAYKRPKQIHVLAELPKNPSGKIMKKALRAM